MILDDNGNTPLHCLSDATREDSLLNFMEKFDVSNFMTDYPYTDHVSEKFKYP